MTPFFQHLIGRHEPAAAPTVRPRLPGRFEGGALPVGLGPVEPGPPAWGPLARGEEPGRTDQPHLADRENGDGLGYRSGTTASGDALTGGPNWPGAWRGAMGARRGAFGRDATERDAIGRDDHGDGKFAAPGREDDLNSDTGPVLRPAKMRPTESLDMARPDGASFADWDTVPGGLLAAPPAGLEEMAIRALAERLSRVGRDESGPGTVGDANRRRIRPGQQATGRIQTAPAAEPVPTIKVTIGRIEVKAAGGPAVPENRKPVDRKKVRMSLDEFLKTKKDPA